MTQTAAILEALKQGSRITQLDAYRRFRCTRLAPRILELKQAGYPIRTRMLKTEGTVVAEYSWGEQMELGV